MIKQHTYHKFRFLLILLSLILICVIIVLMIKMVALIQRNKHPYAANLNDKSLAFTQSSDLAYFFEPEANTTDTDNPDWLGYKASYTHNSDGLNERFDYPVQKPSDSFRIITLGASYVYGLYVNTRENFSEVLEDELNKRTNCQNYKKFEVINLGFPAYDIRYNVERYIRKGIKYKPDLILWLLYDDNFIRVNEYILPIEKKLADEGIPVYDPETQTYERNQKAINEFNRQYSFETILDYQKKALWLISDYFTGDLLIAYFPSMRNVYKNLIDEFVSSRKDINLIGDLTDVGNLNAYSLPDGHPNREGHNVLAQDLLRYIERTYLTDCQIKK